MSFLLISSLQNTRVKELVVLQQKASLRREMGVAVVEGLHELKHCVNSGVKVLSVFFCPEIIPFTELPTISKEVEVVEVTRAVMDKISYRGSTEGILALVEPQYRSLEKLTLSANPLLLILEAVEKPGNLGAILRTADAVAADAVIVCDPRTDLFNPNVIRSSVGCVFTVQMSSCTNEEARVFLKGKGIKSYAAALTAKDFFQDANLSGPLAFLMGTEADGLSEFWLQHADEQLKIPMLGQNDSLNVSVSTAVLAYEARRQRGYSTKM